jgi:thiamine-monophosphate kinase
VTSIGDIGEDELIGLFAPRLPSSDAEILGPGDDAAIVAVDGHLVVSSDVLIEGRHFRQDWGSGADVGWRAAMQNLADIDAMGAVPTALQITLAAPPATPVAWVLGFADGLREACEPHGVGVVGGDLSGASEIAISVTALGETHGVEPVTRADASPGDVLAVSGALGASAAGLAQLIGGVRVVDDAVRLFLRPRPRIGAGVEAALSGATAMLDISDGLLRDAERLARASEVVLEIDSALVPVHAAALATAVELGADPMVWALTGGEDHHLVATFSTQERIPDGWTVIGKVRSGTPGVLLDGGAPGSLGWDHFGG